MKVFLIGFMGSGKSFLGKELASQLNYEFCDTDSLIVESENNTIDKIFSEKGEDFFRNKEKEVIRRMELNESVVISTGGGLPCYHNNMEWMNGHGITVYLEASPGFLFQRLHKEKDARPLISKLSDKDLMGFIIMKLKERREFYQKAHLRLNAASIDTKKLKQKILSFERSLA